MIYLINLFAYIYCVEVPVIYKDAVLIRPAYAKDKHLSARTLDVVQGNEEDDLFDRKVLKGIARSGSIPYNRLSNKSGDLGLNKDRDKLVIGTEWKDVEMDTNISFTLIANSYHRISINDLCLKYEEPEVSISECPRRDGKFEDLKKFSWVIETYVRKEDLEKCKNLFDQAKNNPGNKNKKDTTEEDSVNKATPGDNIANDTKNTDKKDVDEDNAPHDSKKNQESKPPSQDENTPPKDSSNDQNYSNDTNNQPKTYPNNVNDSQNGGKSDPKPNYNDSDQGGQRNENTPPVDSRKDENKQESQYRNNDAGSNDLPNSKQNDFSDDDKKPPVGSYSSDNTNPRDNLDNRPYDDDLQTGRGRSSPRNRRRRDDFDTPQSNPTDIDEKDEDLHARIYELLNDLSSHKKQNLLGNRGNNIPSKDSEDNLGSIYRFLHETVNDYQNYRYKH